MDKKSLAKAFNSLKTAVSKRSPEILTGIGIAGMITTTVLAVKATPKALILLEEAEEEKNMRTLKGPGELYLTPIEMVKAAWKPYIPAAVTCAASVACLIGASSVHARRNAALATAYNLSRTAFSEYREKVVETIGEKKEQVVRERIDKDRIEKNPISKNEVIVTKKGETLCLDPISKRYFKSDIELINRAVNELNRRMTYDMYVSLSEFYDELGLDHTLLSDDLGWNLDGGLIEINYSAQVTDDDRPCIVLNYNIAPKYDYYKLC